MTSNIKDNLALNHPITTTVVTTDITHPAVDIIEVTASSKGAFNLERARTVLNDWAAEVGVPSLRENGLGIALKRAMEALAHGPARDLKILGRGHGAVFTLMTTDLSAADLECHDGVGIGNAEVTARLKLDSVTPSIVISPNDHPRAFSILEAFHLHRQQVCATHDVKSWLQQQALPALGAMKSPDARGKAWIPATPESVKAVQSLKVALAELATADARINLYVTGRSGEDASIVDLITDTLIEEAQRVRVEISTSLKKASTMRGCESQGDKAMKLRQRLKLVSDAFNIGSGDIDEVVNSLERDIAIAIASIPSEV